MKRHCIYCKKTIEENEEVCPFCGKNQNSSKMTVKDVHELHQNAHNNITINTDKKNSGLVFLVTGAILLIVGALFLFLSFKFNSLREREFRPASIEFVVCCICLSISLFELVFGTIKLVGSLSNIKFYKSVIQETKLKK